jgi:hypothetical protein
VSVTDNARATLRDRAAAVLHGNDAGTWTKASALLYPHQWRWDSAFIAMGWAHLDVRRAMTELEGLFAAQWSTGMVRRLYAVRTLSPAASTASRVILPFPLGAPASGAGGEFMAMAPSPCGARLTP